MYSAELKKIVEVFELESVLPELSLEGRSVLRKEINRPALQLAGFYERFDSDRLQVIGRVEYSYLLSLNDEDRKNAIRHLFQYHIPCLVVCKNLEIFPEMVEYGREYSIPIFRTAQNTTDFTAERGTGRPCDDARRSCGYLRRGRADYRCKRHREKRNGTGAD